MKATWALYAESDDAASKLMGELEQKGVKRADRVPILSEILKSLEGKAPDPAMTSLLEFKEISWKHLNSYVHGGIHAIYRHSQGYPKELLAQILKATNGLSTMVGMLLVILSGDKTQLGKMSKIQMQYADCLPELKTDGM